MDARRCAYLLESAWPLGWPVESERSQGQERHKAGLLQRVGGGEE